MYSIKLKRAENIMKAISNLFLLLSLASLPEQASSSCAIHILENLLYGANQEKGLIFKGTVISDFSPPEVVATSVFLTDNSTENDEKLIDWVEEPYQQLKKYVVQIEKVYQGCVVKGYDRIVVTSEGPCGMTLVQNATYVLSSSNIQLLDNATKAELGNRSKATRSMSIQQGNYNRAWSSVPEADRAMLRTFPKNCPKKR
jgi:hypothetical protein